MNFLMNCTWNNDRGDSEGNCLRLFSKNSPTAFLGEREGGDLILWADEGPFRDDAKSAAVDTKKCWQGGRESCHELVATCGHVPGGGGGPEVSLQNQWGVSAPDLKTLSLTQSALLGFFFFFFCEAAPPNSSCNFPCRSHPGPSRRSCCGQAFNSTFLQLFFRVSPACPSLPSLQVVNRWPPGAAREVDDSGFGPSGKDDEQASEQALLQFAWCLPRSPTDLVPLEPQTHSQNTSMNHSLRPSHWFIYLFIYICVPAASPQLTLQTFSP